MSSFDGFRLLTLSSYYPHKNIDIIPSIIDILESNYPEFAFQFVLSINKNDFWRGKLFSEKHDRHLLFLGQVSIEQCPYLYEQCHAMFLPTVLECFSASYVEAMKMQKPILTSDLGFAKGICNDAALYFSPTSATDIAEKVYLLAHNQMLQKQLIKSGNKQLHNFNSPEQRVRMMLDILTKDI